MRRIDRIAGVPLCFLASGFLKIWRRLRPRPPRPIRRILFIELSEMGSAVLADPAMRKARERTGAENYFVIFTQNAGSLSIMGTIDPCNVFTIGTSSLWQLAIDTLGFLRWTRRNAIDTVVDLELFSRFTALLTGLSGAERRIGFHRFYNEGLYRGEMLTHRVDRQEFHCPDRCTLEQGADVPYSKTVVGDDELTLPVRPLSAAARDRVDTKIRTLAGRDPARSRLVLINANASDMLPQRRWMRERFVELIRRILAANDDAFVLLTGAPDERPDAEVLAAQCASNRCIAFAGHTELADLPALYARAAVMVSNDSGPAHFAAACGLPTIVLFGPETPHLYRPLGNSTALYAGLACSPCVSASNHRKSACNDNVCMRAISVEQVFKAVDDVLTAQVREPT